VTPTSLLQAISQKVALPFLVGCRSDPERSRRATTLIVAGMSVAAALYALPIGIAVDKLLPRLYGTQYQITQSLSALAMLVAFLRFCRGGPTVILLHRGATRQLTVSTLTAAVGTFISFLLGLWFRRLEGVMAGLVIGDLLSMSVLLYLVRRDVPVRPVLRVTGPLMLVVGLYAAALCGPEEMGTQARLVLLLCGTVAVMVEAILVYRHFARGIINFSERERKLAQTVFALLAGRWSRRQTLL
jgi:hypothetical protein